MFVVLYGSKKFIRFDILLSVIEDKDKQLIHYHNLRTFYPNRNLMDTNVNYANCNVLTILEMAKNDWN